VWVVVVVYLLPGLPGPCVSSCFLPTVMTTKAASTEVLHAYRAILRELYKAVRILRNRTLVFSHLYAF